MPGTVVIRCIILVVCQSFLPSDLCELQLGGNDYKDTHACKLYLFTGSFDKFQLYFFT